MKNIQIEIKWALIFSITGLVWMVLEKLCGLHGKYIDYHLYLTNLFAIPAIIIMVMALKDKKKNFYGGQMNYKQGLISGLVLSAIIALLSPLTRFGYGYCNYGNCNDFYTDKKRRNKNERLTRVSQKWQFGELQIEMYWDR